MIGNPIYREGDFVHFKAKISTTEKIRENEEKEVHNEPFVYDFAGEVFIVDAHGTFEQNEEPSYDILVEDWFGSGESCLFKHVRESAIVGHEDEVIEAP